MRLMITEEYLNLRRSRNILRDEHDRLTGRDAGRIAAKIKEIDVILSQHEWNNPEDQSKFEKQRSYFNVDRLQARLDYINGLPLIEDNLTQIGTGEPSK